MVLRSYATQTLGPLLGYKNVAMSSITLHSTPQLLQGATVQVPLYI
jgi:hypothetical protein